MDIKQIGANLTEIHNSPITVLYSFNVPVAAYCYGTGHYRTDAKCSKATTRHINKWIGGMDHHGNAARAIVLHHSSFIDMIRCSIIREDDCSCRIGLKQLDPYNMNKGMVYWGKGRR